jgi:hypothetical protein
MSEDHHFTISGDKWLWRYTNLRGQAIGWTYMPRNASGNGGRKILIHSKLTGRARLNVEIHEFLHASNPTQSEEHVSQQGDDLARILWALGYRIKEDH